MYRTVFLVVAVTVVACAPTRQPAPQQMSAVSAPVTSGYEPAPVVSDINFGVPPDLRDKICGQTQIRGSDYDTTTKSTNSFCR